MNPREHWERVYQTKDPTDVSWFQTIPTLSLQLIQAAEIDKDQSIIDVGGGASVLVDQLLENGFQRVAVLDLSAAALAHARNRLGRRATLVEWFEADVTTYQPPHPFALWHDRAVLHFLTDAVDRQRYVQTLKRALTPRGHAIIATFAMDGPSRCSELEVTRYDAATLSAQLGEEFELLQTQAETHRTPWDTEQNFNYFLFRRQPAG